MNIAATETAPAAKPKPQMTAQQMQAAQMARLATMQARQKRLVELRQELAANPPRIKPLVMLIRMALGTHAFH